MSKQMPIATPLLNALASALVTLLLIAPVAAGRVYPVSLTHSD